MSPATRFALTVTVLAVELAALVGVVVLPQPQATIAAAVTWLACGVALCITRPT